MAWIFIAITSHFCWALVNVGDKYLISNRIKNPYVYFSWLVFGMSIMFFLIPFIQYYFPPFYLLKWIILGSIASFLGALLYFKSITIEEISRINMWWNMIPLFSFLIAWITLGEILTLNQGIAFIILMFGAILASIHIQKTRVLFSRALLLMTLACFLFAVQAVTTHHVTQEIPFTHVFITNIMFMILLSCSLFLSTSFRRDFRTEIKKINISLGTAVLSISILDGLGYFFNAWALSLGPVALVYAMEGNQSLFVFIIVIIASLLKPKILNEDIHKKNVVVKLIALFIIIIGILILYIT